ncbi:MAG TPA: ectonucleotide pyrophosphatase/phosphodiesterase [Pirellulales bacterium]|nr:ectonucleotide pyrophosphatase/phosphodiesterase [Pirellulales bacterium]
MRRWYRMLSLVVVIFCPTLARSAELPEAAVIVVSVDGLAAFYWQDTRAALPTLHELAAHGAYADAMQTVAPTVTWPNHTTLVTGVTPARHGVVGNDYYDRALRQPVPLMTDPAGNKEPLVRVPTIYDWAKQRGLGTAAIRWPATRDAKGLDWTVPDVFSDRLLHEYSTPQLVAECKAAGVWADGEVVQAGPKQYQVISDDTCTRVFNFILERHKPGLALLHLTHVDYQQHVKGPRTDDAYAAMAAADEQVRLVWETVKRVYGARATLIVISDHGFSPVERLVMPNVILKEAGLLDVEGDKVREGATHVIVQGGAALVYIDERENRAALVDRVRKALSGKEGVAKIVAAADFADHRLAQPAVEPRSPDFLLLAEEGWSFGDSAIGPPTIAAPPGRKGAHGHDEHLPAMDAVFVAWGRGIKAGTHLERVSNIDVAPTVARLLNLALDNVDGKPISGALAD